LAKRRKPKTKAVKSQFYSEDAPPKRGLISDESFDSQEMIRSAQDRQSDDVMVGSGELVSDQDLEESFGEEEGYLNEFGLPIPHRTDNDRRARVVFAELRDACRACPYRRICSFAPVALHVRRTIEPKARHSHSRILRYGLKKLLKTGEDWYITLLNLMVERSRDGHLAGCLLAEAWRQYPERMADLLNVVKERSAPLMTHTPTIDAAGHARKLQPGDGVDPRMLVAQAFRGQLIRAASFFEDEELFHSIHDTLEFIPDQEGRLHQHEIVAALTLFVTDDISAQEWIEELEGRSPEPFRATFAWKLFDEDIIAMFFPYRRGNKRSYLYVMRNEDGREFITSIDKQPLSEVLDNLFAVFDTDERKTYRIFKEICRHINVRAGKYNADLVLEGFERLKREDLLLFAIYAPALARAVSHFLQLDRFDLLIKFLYRLRASSGRRGEEVIPAHEKIFKNREEWTEVREIIGDTVCREFFKMLFRLNSSYSKSVYTTNTFIKLGEAAYLLTALSGWNPRGLDMELKSRKALAFIAYGLQPADKWSAIRTRKFARVMDLHEDDQELWRAVKFGAVYMAEIHEYPSFEALLQAAQKGDELAAYDPDEENQAEQIKDELEASAEEAYAEPVEDEASAAELVSEEEPEEEDDDEESDIVPPPPSPRQSTLRSGFKNRVKNGSGLVKNTQQETAAKDRSRKSEKMLESSASQSSVLDSATRAKKGKASGVKRSKMKRAERLEAPKPVKKTSHKKPANKLVRRSKKLKSAPAVEDSIKSSKRPKRRRRGKKP
jgi:hypothetical protein